MYKFDGNAGKRGNVSSKTVTGSSVPNQTVNYSYNDANEHTYGTTGTQDYDSNGNLTRRGDGLALTIT